jgi:hypothetical protein
MFALMGVVSGWVAWRRSPLFSTRSTLRFLLVLALLLSAVIGAIIAAVDFSETQSVAVGMTAVGSVIVLGTIAMIWVIVVVSTPKSVALPASVKMLSPFRRRVFTWVKRVVCGVLVWAALLAVVPGIWQSIIAVIGGLFVFLAFVLCFTAYLSARQMDRWLSAVEADPWVHWSYSPGQWQQWTDAEVARTPVVHQFVWGRDWHKLAWPVLAIAIGAVFLWPGPWIDRALYVAGITTLLVAVLLSSQRGDAHAPQRLRSTLMKADPEAYFGQDGVFAYGVFTPWLTIGVYLVSASIDDRAPPSLVLRFEKATLAPAVSQSTTVDVIVPLADTPTVAADLTRLQEKLAARCPAARVTIAAISD